MKDNEIIEAIEYCMEQGITSECERCTDKIGCRDTLLHNALNLINRQKAEIKALRETIQRGDFTSITAQRANELWHRENCELIDRLKAEIEKKGVEIDILIRKNKTLKDEVSESRAEVERLQEANKSFSCMGLFYSEIKSEARKEFAERLTDRISDKLDRSSDNPDGDNYFITDVFADIENLLAEMESEGK